MMDKLDLNNLTGKCLISAPYADEDDFTGTLIYICLHNHDGAMGFIINKKIKEFSFQDLAFELPIQFKDPYMSVGLYQGGPLERTKGFILHSDEYHLSDSLNTGSGIIISSSLGVLQDIASGAGPKQKMIALGYAGWAPNQLENEIMHNRWLVTTATPELVFNSNDSQKMSEALSSLGIDLNNLAPIVGHS